MKNNFNTRVGVILVNWCGWRDTQLSLETLFGSDYLYFDAVVVDNASDDNSVKHLIAWAEGSELVDTPVQLIDRVKVRDTKSVVPYVYLDAQAHASFNGNVQRLTIIQAGENCGFAGGNNIGLTYLRQHGCYDYFWLLNNDAFPAPDALSHMVARALNNPSLGQIGATLIFAGRPEVVQAHGGAVYEHKSGRAYHIGAESNVVDLPDVQESDVEERMSYVVGASILVTDRFLDRIGVMEESYFLYFEELDWAERGKPEFGLGYARDALVYHKAGGSTQKASRRSVMAAYYLARNRIIVTKRFYPAFVSSVKRSIFIEFLKYVARARWSEARGYFRALRESFGIAYKVGRP